MFCLRPDAIFFPYEKMCQLWNLISLDFTSFSSRGTINFDQRDTLLSALSLKKSLMQLTLENQAFLAFDEKILQLKTNNNRKPLEV